MTYTGEVSCSTPLSGTMFWHIENLFLKYKGTFSEEGFF